MKMNKAALLFMFKKLDDIRLRNLKHGLSSIATAFPNILEQPSIIQKSNTQTNLSFNFNNNIEMSMIYKSSNRRSG